MARIAILTCSDKGASGGRADLSGDVAERRCRGAGHHVTVRAIVSDDLASIATRLEAWCEGAEADIVLTIGGTGLGPRDVTPEATRAVGERDVPGLPIALAIEGLKKTPHAVLSRGVAMTRGRTLIVNLPGNPRAVEEGLDVLLPLFDHMAEVMAGPREHLTEADTGHGNA